MEAGHPGDCYFYLRHLAAALSTPVPKGFGSVFFLTWKMLRKSKIHDFHGNNSECWAHRPIVDSCAHEAIPPWGKGFDQPPVLVPTLLCLDKS